MRTALPSLVLVFASTLTGCGSHGPATNAVVELALCFPVPLALGAGASELRAATCEPGAIDGRLSDDKGTLTFTYDAAGLLANVAWAPAKGASETSTFTWDASGLLVDEQLGPALAVGSLLRGANGRVEGRTVTAGGVTRPWTYVYDGDTLGRVEEQRGPDHVRAATLFWTGAQLDTRQVTQDGDVVEDWSYFWSGDGLDTVQTTVGERTTTLDIFRDADGQPHTMQTTVGSDLVEHLDLFWTGTRLDRVQAARDDGSIHEQMSFTYDASGRVAGITLD